MVTAALKAAGHAVTGVAAAVKEANDLTDSMIDNLKANENLTINRVGRTLEGIKFGFLLGYVSPSILTAVGVCLTGGDLLFAAGAGIAVLGNPVAATCAAVGAVFFGWKALSDNEREQILSRVGKFLNVGWEQIKAVVEFAIKLMKDLFTADNLKEIKETVAEAALAVGGHISDITKSVRDKVSKFADMVRNTASAAAGAVSETAEGATNAVKGAADQVSSGASKAGHKVKDAFSREQAKEVPNNE